MSRKITITQALTELKLYDSKIRKAVDRAAFVGADRKVSNNIGHMTKEEYEKKAKADYQSICDLIANRAQIKSAIARSNAQTMVEVNGEAMTVTEAIERKNSIVYDKYLLDELRSQYTKAVREIQAKNLEIDKQVEHLLDTLAGRESTLTRELQETTEQTYRENNAYGLVDALNASELIAAMQEKIDGFLSQVDVALSISNATTFIEVN